MPVKPRPDFSDSIRVQWSLEIERTVAKRNHFTSCVAKWETEVSKDPANCMLCSYDKILPTILRVYDRTSIQFDLSTFARSQTIAYR